MFFAGVEVAFSYTLWETPVFARSGSMLPIAPPPGLTDDGVGGGPKADYQPALGMAQVSAFILLTKHT